MSTPSTISRAINQVFTRAWKPRACSPPTKPTSSAAFRCGIVVHLTGRERPWSTRLDTASAPRQSGHLSSFMSVASNNTFSLGPARFASATGSCCRHHAEKCDPRRNARRRFRFAHSFGSDIFSRYCTQSRSAGEALLGRTCGFGAGGEVKGPFQTSPRSVVSCVHPSSLSTAGSISRWWFLLSQTAALTPLSGKATYSDGASAY